MKKYLKKKITKKGEFIKEVLWKEEININVKKTKRADEFKDKKCNAFQFSTFWPIYCKRDNLKIDTNVNQNSRWILVTFIISVVWE